MASDAGKAIRVPLETALVARKYFLDGMQKSEIALEFGISRFKVARLLEEAKSAGIVRIWVDLPTEVDVGLGEELARRYGLRQVIVAKSVEDLPGATGEMMARLAAEFLMSTLRPDDTLGISWGSTVARVIDEIDSLPAVDIVQMVGGVRSSALDTNGGELVRRLTQVGAGRAFPLMVPLIVDSAATAVALKNDAAIADVFKRFHHLSLALVGVGSWEPAQSSLLTELPPGDHAEARNNGAVADVCGIIVDADGGVVESAVGARTLSIGFEQLKETATVLAVAGGIDKAHAVQAAMKSGLVDVLVTDSDCATGILASVL